MTNLPKLALGTWLMGGDIEPDPENDDQRDIRAIRIAIENDVNLIDTAQIYANGKCETLVGQALEGLPRDSFMIMTKQNKQRMQFDQVIEDFKASMKRLKIDHVDYFLAHAPNPDQEMAEFFRATNQLIDQGLLKNVGVSNFGPKMLELAIRESDVPISVNQVNFSLNNDDFLSSGTYDFCVENHIPIQAYRVFADIEQNQKAQKLLEEIALREGVTPKQVALSYINSYQDIHFTIRASSSAHWDEIKQALTDVALSDKQIKQLRDSHRNLSGRFGKFLKL